MVIDISFQKLQDLFASNELLVSKYFLHRDKCRVIELISSVYAEKILLYISDEYSLDVAIVENTYILHTANIDSAPPLPIEEKYSDANMFKVENSDINKKNPSTNIEKTLTERYNKPLNNLDDGVDESLEDVTKQLMRLKFCVQNVKLKLGIIFRNFLCLLSNDNTLLYFSIENFPKSNKRKMYVVVNLEYFYDNLSNVMVNVRHLEKGVYDIISRNHQSQINALNYIISLHASLPTYSTRILQQEQNYKQHITCFKELLPKILDLEKKHLEKLKGTNIPNEQLIIQRKLDQIIIIKNEIIESVLILKDRCSDMALTFDKVFFDNTIIVSKLMDNFKVFEKMCRNFFEINVDSK